MMDNKCKPANNKYIDHLYCHTSDGKNYIRANNNTSTDIILKENKQLKAMLILHLDLIQEQSDQLLAKDKVLTTFREEIESLKHKNEQLERQIQQMQRQQNSSKRSTNGNNMEMISLLPPPLAKIQGTVENRQPQTERQHSLVSKSATPEEVSHGKTSLKRNYKIQESNSTNVSQDENAKGTSIIGECNGKFISKIILHRINVTGMSPSTASETSENDENVQSTHDEDNVNDSGKEEVLKEKRSKKSNANRLCVQNVEKREKIDSDESISGDSVNEKYRSNLSRGTGKVPQLPHQPQQRPKRCGYITTSEMYCTREWEDEDFCDEFIKEEAKALKADAPMLEIPKWTVHDFNASYSIEGTEDLSDETFLKRHAKLEYDEKRRKKWDVQQIREQRRIERLKRRHCKDEVRDTTAANTMLSFYPQPNSIQAICYISDLPVLAFGEGIPRLSVNADFTLPWRQQQSSHSVEIPTSSCHVPISSGVTSQNQNQNQQQKSSFVFMKKRRRQQSVSGMQIRSRGGNTRGSTNNLVLSQGSSQQSAIVSGENV